MRGAPSTALRKWLILYCRQDQHEVVVCAYTVMVEVDVVDDDVDYDDNDRGDEAVND